MSSRKPTVGELADESAASLSRSLQQAGLDRFPGGLSVEALLESVLQHSELILWAIDQRGDFVLSRGAGLHALNLSDDQVLGQNVFELYANHPPILRAVQDALDGNEHRDSTEVNGASFQSWYCPIRNSDEDVVGVVGISTVITELTTTRQALDDATSQFHLAFERSPVVMALIQLPGGEFLDVNLAFEQALGYRREEVCGRNNEELNLWDCPFLKRDPNFDFSQLMTFHNEEIVSRTKTGEELVLVASGARLRVQSEDCILLFARNETDESKTLKALERSEQRFAALARQASVGIFQCNAGGQILDGNAYFWSCLGREPEHAGIPWFSLFATETEVLAREWLEAVEQNKSFQRELPVKSSRTGVEWVRLELAQFSDEERGYIGTLVDVTAAKRAEATAMLQRRELEKAVRNRTLELERLNERLREEVERRKNIAHELTISKERMQAVVNNAVDFIMNISPSGHIEFINRVAEGLTPEQVIGSHFSEWLTGKDLARGREAIRQIFEENKTVSFEIPIHYPNGTVELMAMRGAPIRIDDVTIGASMVARDITRERELESEARQRGEELTHLSRLSLVGEMSASMSHELKQPLLAIGNYANGCLHRLQEGMLDGTATAESLQRIARLSEKACQILQRTRRFAAKRPVAPEPTAIQDIVRDALQFVQTELDERQIRVEQHYVPGLPICCLDPVQIQQVIVNLLMNAIEAIAVSRKSRPHSIQFQVTHNSPGGIQVHIRDSADGIEEDIRDNFFSAFQTSKPQGLGMGLAISRTIVENHGGTLTIEESSPEGTTFLIKLPPC